MYFFLYKFQWECFGKANLKGNINPQHPVSASVEPRSILDLLDKGPV